MPCRWVLKTGDRKGQVCGGDHNSRTCPDKRKHDQRRQSTGVAEEVDGSLADLLAEAFDFHSEEEDGAGGLGARATGPTGPTGHGP